MVHQNHEDEKNLSEFFEVCLTDRRTLMRSSPVSSLMRFDKREFFKTPSASSLLDEASPRASEFSE
jgi:hypothetical protein